MFDNLEFVIRSDVPQDIKDRCRDIGNIRIIDKVIPFADLEMEFMTADIFLLPVHNTPFSVFLEAMSYELPVVTLDSWANPEVISHEKTGLFVNKSARIPYYTAYGIPNFGTAAFRESLRTPDPIVVAELAAQTAKLIEKPELRRKLGKAGRAEVENGRFSVEARKEKLKKVFDEATA